MLVIILLTVTFLLLIFLFCFFDFKRENKGRLKRITRMVFPYPLIASIVLFIFLTISLLINIVWFSNYIILTNHITELSNKNVELKNEQEYWKKLYENKAKYDKTPYEDY